MSKRKVLVAWLATIWILLLGVAIIVLLGVAIFVGLAELAEVLGVEPYES